MTLTAGAGLKARRYYARQKAISGARDGGELIASRGMIILLFAAIVHFSGATQVDPVMKWCWKRLSMDKPMRWLHSTCGISDPFLNGSESKS